MSYELLDDGKHGPRTPSVFQLLKTEFTHSSEHPKLSHQRSPEETLHKTLAELLNQRDVLLDIMSDDVAAEQNAGITWPIMDSYKRRQRKELTQLDQKITDIRNELTKIQTEKLQRKKVQPHTKGKESPNGHSEAKLIQKQLSTELQQLKSIYRTIQAESHVLEEEITKYSAEIEHLQAIAHLPDHEGRRNSTRLEKQIEHISFQKRSAEQRYAQLEQALHQNKIEQEILALRIAQYDWIAKIEDTQRKASKLVSIANSNLLFHLLLQKEHYQNELHKLKLHERKLYERQQLVLALGQLEANADYDALNKGERLLPGRSSSPHPTGDSILSIL